MVVAHKSCDIVHLLTDAICHFYSSANRRICIPRKSSLILQFRYCKMVEHDRFPNAAVNPTVLVKLSSGLADFTRALLA